MGDESTWTSYCARFGEVSQKKLTILSRLNSEHNTTQFIDLLPRNKSNLEHSQAHLGSLLTSLELHRIHSTCKDCLYIKKKIYIYMAVH